MTTEAFAALAVVESLVATSEDRLVVLARESVAAVLVGAPPVEPSVASGFAQQMTLDVASVSDADRAAALDALGRDAFGFVQAVYVADMGTRVRRALAQLLGVTLPHPSAVDGALWPAIEDFMRCVARLSALDPVTTELVRLRGARAHDCRLCQSLRDTRALEAGASEALLAGRGLTSRQQAAVELVDAMIWTPTAFPSSVVSAVRAELSDEEVVEVVLDVMRNAGNKVAVALGADAARVTEGVELYTVNAEGDPVYSGATRR
ncbi:MAG: Uncharacterized protein JWO22_971 [Frankiales bacterium]|nr:Uncharacterized protein [Frankiales bacterium]